ncbi:MAG TPA: UDP-N-acetylmuramoyl-L-alanine--D-glutamate ligase [Anaeromyxobacteraceae bacterium]|nr:UDP-N-acetylmuramoyl-L-alanine--D-glutamate ligase [Anaeromyxobacteraceae bacterium]
MGFPASLEGARVTVVGLARSGVAAARLAGREGALVTVTDRRPAGELAAQLDALQGTRVRAVLGGHDLADFERADLVVVSPGVPLSIPPLAAARAAGVPVVGEVELAWRFLGGLPVVGITGTNGKSTTTALAAALFAEDRPTFAGGNLGTPLSELLLDGPRAEVAVVELSSFQLEGVETFRPAVGAITNVTPDHLDRYAGVPEYAAAKGRLFANQGPGDFAVANARDELALRLARSSKGALHTFGFGPPAQRSARCAAGTSAEVVVTPAAGDEERYALRSRALRGSHNRENAMAAILCARLMGVPAAAVQRGLDAFPGLPHRLELVRERGGVEWVNDSKGTNVDSTAVGLAAFEAGRPSLVLIMGGHGKGAPYAPLRALFPGRVKALLTIGEDAPAVERELGDLCATEGCGTLSRAVARAAALTGPGEVVLLSPACSSYDQFENYEQRGAAFRRLVEELP